MENAIFPGTFPSFNITKSIKKILVITYNRTTSCTYFYFNKLSQPLFSHSGSHVLAV